MTRRCVLLWVCLVGACLMFAACKPDGKEQAAAPVPPRGFVQVLEITASGRLYRFGPFVGYYFKPKSQGNLRQLSFICFNQDQFYTRDLPPGAKLFEGDAVLVRLADTGDSLPDTGRTSPVFFDAAPAAWLDSRPAPRDEYLHFHSCYDATGAVREGFWLRHRALAAFTYDMGGRVEKDSPLFHRVAPGIDKEFARIVEFDRGPIQGQ